MAVSFLSSTDFSNNFAATQSLSTQKEIKLSKADKEKLDTYFSNFSEVALDKFSELDVRNETILHFGLYHNWINNRNLFKITGSYAAISEKYVLDSIYKYFGIEVRFSSSLKAKTGFSAGKYKIKCSDGEAFKFSQLDKFFSLGNNYYLCYLTNYYAGSGFTGNTHKPISELNKDKDPGNHVNVSEKIVAKVKKVLENGIYRYILLSYETKK